MNIQVPERIHVAPLGVEFDRIVQPAVEGNADRVVLVRFLPDYLPEQARDEGIENALSEQGITCETVEAEVTDLFDAVAAFGQVLDRYGDENVYVNLASGNKLTAIGGMIACMAEETAQPYYVEAEEHGSLHLPAPSGVRSIDKIPSYPIDHPDYQHLAIMEFIASSDRTTSDGEPYRVKHELFEYGEAQGLPFMSDYEGETDKGKFRRLDAHVVTPLVQKGFLEVEKVHTKKRVFLTEDGKNTLRAFTYRLRASP